MVWYNEVKGGDAMKLNYDRNSKNPTYFIQHGIRNGPKTTTKNIKRIGRHLDLLAITDDPLAYAKEQVALFNKEFSEGKIEIGLNVDFNEKLTATTNISSKSTSLNVGYFVLQKIYQDLNIKQFIQGIQENTKTTFDGDDVNRFVTFARILDPRSKLGTFNRLQEFYEQPNFDYQHILRFMDVLEDNYDEYLEHLFINSENVVKRDTTVCYLDFTNYYFEIEQEDEDYIDEVTGETFKGIRKYGRSKDHKPNPLVQMGLFMDGSGIPLSMSINSGSDNEQKCALPLEKKITKMFKGKKFIYCADAGLGSLKIREYNSKGGRAFIVTQSVKKLSDVLKKAVFNDYEYRRLSNNSKATIEQMKTFDRFDKKNLDLYEDSIYKVLYASRAIDVGLYEDKVLKNGKTIQVKSKAVLKQKVIITFSRKMMEFQRKVRNGQVERARKILKYKNVEDVKKGPNDVKRFIKRTSVGKQGEKASDHYKIDDSLIEEEEKYDGYYAVATNLDDDVKTIIGIASQRYKIEECFRLLKNDFSGRPVHHRNKERIVAHFMICYTALLIYRLLEVKLNKYGTPFTTENIIETLKNMNVTNVQDAFYTAAYTSSKVCTSLNGIFNLGLDKKNHLPKELNKKIRKISR